MPKLKFNEAVTVTTMALGLPGQPYQLPKGAELEVDAETAAKAKKIYEGRVDILPDKSSSSKKES